MAKGKSGMGARALLRQHFINNIGRKMDSDELRKVSGDISEWARRVRELRTEEGYQILTHNDRSELKPGEYLLETAKPIPAFAREISKEARAYILDRNGFTCQMCGAVAGEPHPYDQTRKTRLHIGHVIDKSKGGTDEYSNLRAICSVCNEGASNITLTRPGLKDLLTSLRRATSDDQKEALCWLAKKFPKLVELKISASNDPLVSKQDKRTKTQTEELVKPVVPENDFKPTCSFDEFLANARDEDGNLIVGKKPDGSS